MLQEAGFSEAAPFLFGIIAVGIVIFTGLAVLMGKPGKIALVTSMFMMNFSYVEGAMKMGLPDLKYWHTVPIVMASILHITCFLCLFLEDDTAREVSMVLCRYLACRSC